ncbi:UbiD family decarboxylase [Trichlorobacter ammonificans]|uniref:3-polyprenyl-4-hydroxybenzoate carboxy-lyase n=1 Tax=Trichlorobacter ammonificans TaxID=2916410 RepID=A0ABM9D9B3_9BACT|nr:UbiD family decarboxylase [Trichlorobacter ammonificans]CAH2031804.1 3-polyprenyl-4-hydroxybenzoate carboxy-lyase [Trichlorobacter ammonificans]
MGYADLQSCIADLERHGRLRRIGIPVDPYLEAGMIQRRVYRAGGPALLFTNVTGSSFPLLGNLFGTLERTRFLFRDSLKTIETLVRLKINPFTALRDPLDSLGAGLKARHLLPKTVAPSSAPVLRCRTTLAQLPRLVSWPLDGGPFITLPQVYSESPLKPGVGKSNLGMYRVQLAGNRYEPDRQAGLHYQIHRGIGVHHAEAKARGERLKVNIFVGGAPAMTVAAVMPLPEGMPELSFAGLLAGQRIAMATLPGHLPVPAEADFCIVGSIEPTATLPEGPFGDHLGYYSLEHPFPFVEVEAVYHRPDAVWPFTTVGRPPQEDTSFGAFIHELTGDLIPTVLPGVKAVHAVDAAGVHPLLLAIGSERYTPYDGVTRPMELLTQANAILGQGQLSLAKYLLIVAEDDNPALDIHQVDEFLQHLLARVDWRRDLHFQTATTIDTLDYSGQGLNSGSKVVMAAAGPVRRSLATALPAHLPLPEGCGAPRLALPGVLVVQTGAAQQGRGEQDPHIERFCAFWQECPLPEGLPLVVLVDDSEFTARTLDNLLWVTFTRSNPAVDIYGVGAATTGRHWGCSGALVIDARRKPFHAPPLEEEAQLARRIDDLAAASGPLAGLW